MSFKIIFTSLSVAALVAVIALTVIMSGRRAEMANLATEVEPAESPVSGNAQTAGFSGGCFWGVDALFKHVKGVTSVKSGYAGGKAGTAEYERVSTGDTG